MTLVAVPECTGACCVAFVLSNKPHRMANRIDRGTMIAEMVSPISYDEAAERYALAGFGAMPENTPMDELYTCRYWDDRTHLCRVYDDRPQMCSDYPYGETCVHCQ